MRMTKAMMVIVVAGMALGGGACAPGMKPAGYAGGVILTAGGAAMLGMVSASCSGDDDNFGDAVECVGTGLVFGPIGTAAVVTGLAVLLVTAVSPDGEKANGFVEAKPLPPGAVPVAPPPSDPADFTPQPTAPASRPPSGPPSLPSVSALPSAAPGKPASLAFH